MRMLELEGRIVDDRIGFSLFLLYFPRPTTALSHFLFKPKHVVRHPMARLDRSPIRVVRRRRGSSSWRIMTALAVIATASSSWKPIERPLSRGNASNKYVDCIARESLFSLGKCFSTTGYSRFFIFFPSINQDSDIAPRNQLPFLIHGKTQHRVISYECVNTRKRTRMFSTLLIIHYTVWNFYQDVRTCSTAEVRGSGNVQFTAGDFYRKDREVD